MFMLVTSEPCNEVFHVEVATQANTLQYDFLAIAVNN